MNWSIYQSFSRIPLGIAVTIEFLGPLAVALAGSRRMLDLLWVALAGGGVAALGLGGGHVTTVGVLLALLAGTAWAAYIRLGVVTGRRWNGLDGLAVASAVGAVLLTPFGLVRSGPETWVASTLGTALAVGLLSSVVPYSLEINALRTIPPRTFGILMSLEPAAAALVGLLLLGEQLSTVDWVAIAAVVVASVGATREAPPDPVPANPA
jgi:inner membrane transporter RhtA